jgi:hypothetical protein
MYSVRAVVVISNRRLKMTVLDWLKDVFEALRKALDGKKTYLVAIGGIVTALIAFVNGQIDGVGLVTAVFNAVGAMTIRAGVAKV